MGREAAGIRTLGLQGSIAYINCTLIERHRRPKPRRQEHQAREETLRIHRKGKARQGRMRNGDENDDSICPRRVEEM